MKKILVIGLVLLGLTSFAFADEGLHQQEIANKVYWAGGDKNVFVKLHDCETVWTRVDGSTSTIIVDSTYNVQGIYSCQIDEGGVTYTTTTIKANLPSLDLSNCVNGQLLFYIKMSDADEAVISSIELHIGDSATNNIYWSLVTNQFDTDGGDWNRIAVNIADGFTIVGAGCNWADVDYLALKFTKTSASENIIVWLDKFFASMRPVQIADEEDNRIAISASTATQILYVDTTRSGAIIRNNGSYDIYRATWALTSTNYGFLLEPGDSFVTECTGVVYGLADTTASSVCVIIQKW